MLLVEDDSSVQAALAGALSGRGYQVLPASTAAEALREAAARQLDLIILDLGLPDMDGATALRMIRGVSDVPVIVATARREEASVVQLLEGGADDYVVKPFSSELLVARMRALLRRTGSSELASEVVEVGDLRIDILSRTVSLGDRKLDLSRKEFDLLAYLARHRDQVVSRRSVIENVWNGIEHGSSQSVDVHVSWLRRKLGENAADPRYLHTVRGIGLKLTAPL